jgi:hypothetical protein
VRLRWATHWLCEAAWGRAGVDVRREGGRAGGGGGWNKKGKKGRWHRGRDKVGRKRKLTAQEEKRSEARLLGHVWSTLLEEIVVDVPFLLI